MKINIITNIEAFKALKEDWDILFSKSNCTVFQSFDFNYYSWKHELISDNRNQLAIAVITINESIVAIFPFYIDSNKQLRFINDIHFDFCDFITKESINFSITTPFLIRFCDVRISSSLAVIYFISSLPSYNGESFP